MKKCPYCKQYGCLVYLGSNRYICQSCGRIVKGD